MSRSAGYVSKGECHGGFDVSDEIVGGDSLLSLGSHSNTVFAGTRAEQVMLHSCHHVDFVFLDHAGNVLAVAPD
jgi:hypothetical protein